VIAVLGVEVIVGEITLDWVGTIRDVVKVVVFNGGAVLPETMVVIGAGLVTFVDSTVDIVELGTR